MTVKPMSVVPADEPSDVPEDSPDVSPELSPEEVSELSEDAEDDPLLSPEETPEDSPEEVPETVPEVAETPAGMDEKRRVRERRRAANLYKVPFFTGVSPFGWVAAKSKRPIMSIIPQNVRGDKGEGGAKAVFFMNFLEEKGGGRVIYFPSGNMMPAFGLMISRFAR